MKIRARACIRCKEYVIIFPNDPINQQQIHNFEKQHSEHAVVTLDLEEIKNSYRKIMTAS